MNEQELQTIERSAGWWNADEGTLACIKDLVAEVRRLRKQLGVIRELTSDVLIRKDIDSALGPEPFIGSPIELPPGATHD